MNRYGLKFGSLKFLFKDNRVVNTTEWLMAFALVVEAYSSYSFLAYTFVIEKETFPDEELKLRAQNLVMHLQWYCMHVVRHAIGGLKANSSIGIDCFLVDKLRLQRESEILDMLCRASREGKVLKPVFGATILLEKWKHLRTMNYTSQQVCASALVMLELIDVQDDLQKYLFAYSIRLSLEPQGCIINGTSFSSYQLHWRHWIIRANDIVISDVNGEAVIGQV
ncbi:hypothetical protein JHK87_039388 [Glycine soja]|nr:hypothetical protein JHK87_039388 [Glycine soja]